MKAQAPSEASRSPERTFSFLKLYFFIFSLFEGYFGPLGFDYTDPVNPDQVSIQFKLLSLSSIPFSFLHSFLFPPFLSLFYIFSLSPPFFSLSFIPFSFLHSFLSFPSFFQFSLSITLFSFFLPSKSSSPLMHSPLSSFFVHSFPLLHSVTKLVILLIY